MMDLRPLLSCFAVAALAIAVSGHLPAHFDDRPILRNLLLGLILGVGAMGSMLVPLRIEAGVFLDLRGPLVAVAAFMGGPVSAVVAGGLALALRISLSGVGAAAGCLTIITCTAAGLLCRSTMARRRGAFANVLLLSVLVCTGTIASVFVMPAQNWDAAMRGAIQIVLLSFGGTWLFALSLQRDERHRGLIRRDAYYRAIIEALPDSLNAKDRESRFMAANPATARLMGVDSASDLLGRSDADFYPDDMSKLFLTEEAIVLSGSAVGPIDQEIRFHDGTRRWLTTLKTPLVAHGKVVGIITHNRDITDRKRLEADLLRTRSYLQEAMTHMADGLVLYDRDGVIRFCNEQYRNTFPKTRELRVEGGRFADIIRASVLRGEEEPTADLEAYVEERVRLLHRSGRRLIELNDGRSIELRSRTLPGSDTLIVLADVTAQKQVERELLRRASHDPLTGLANRAAFEFQLDRTHGQAVSTNGSFAVMMLDLDRFKPVNDTHGHAVGDRVLIEVADRLKLTVHEGTMVARLGGDEFALIIVADDIETATVSLANRLVKRLKVPFLTDGIELIPSGSIGIAYYPRNAAQPFELLRLADKALYAVKSKGGAGWSISGVAGEDRPLNPTAEDARTAA